MKGPMIYEVNYPGQQNCTYNDPSLDNEYGAGFNNSSGIGYTGSFQSLVSQYSARIGDQLDFLNIFTNKHNYFSPIPFTSVLHSTFLPESSGAICLTTSCDTTQVSDFFDRANGTVGSNYTAMPGLTLPNITSDLVQGSGVTDYQAYYSGQPWPSGTSQTVEITVGTGQTSCSSTANYYNIIGIFKQAAADSEYALLCFNNTFLLNKVVAGSSNFLSSIAGDLSAGDKLLLNGVVSGGSTILTWWKFASLTQTWTQIDTKTDSSTPFQNGYPVFGLKGTTDYISNFSAWATGAPLQVSGITVTPGGTITGTTSYVELNVFDFATDITVGDGAYYFVVPAGFNGKSVVSLSAQDVTAGVTGTTNIQIAKCSPVATGNMCSGTVVDILSTAETIDSGENKTSTAATPAVINGANAGLLTDDVLRIDIDATSTTKGKGLIQGLGIQ
jgi:hypothetical protein